MKKLFSALLILLVGGMLFAMNAPPDIDQTDVQIELSFDQPAGIQMDVLSATTYEMTDLYMPVPGGDILQTFDAAWSATISIDYIKTGYNNHTDHVAVRKARDGLLYSQGLNTVILNQSRPEANSLGTSSMQTEGLFRLEVGEINGTWPFQETYS